LGGMEGGEKESEKKRKLESPIKLFKKLLSKEGGRRKRGGGVE